MFRNSAYRVSCLSLSPCSSSFFHLVSVCLCISILFPSPYLPPPSLTLSLPLSLPLSPSSLCVSNIFPFSIFLPFLYPSSPQFVYLSFFLLSISLPLSPFLCVSLYPSSFCVLCISLPILCVSVIFSLSLSFSLIVPVCASILFPLFIFLPLFLPLRPCVCIYPFPFHYISPSSLYICVYLSFFLVSFSLPLSPSPRVSLYPFSFSVSKTFYPSLSLCLYHLSIDLSKTLSLFLSVSLSVCVSVSCLFL